MQIISDSVDILLGFVPFIAYVLFILATVWAATKLFPTFGAWMTGTDATDDETEYHTTYAFHLARSSRK